MMDANRSFLLTPPGVGAIAVIRISGDRVEEFLRSHFSNPTKIGSPRHGELREDGRVIDDPVVVRIDSNSADINVHGGPWVIRATLELTQRNGFAIVNQTSLPLAEQAVDGETELEREVLTHLPLAGTETALRLLLAQPALWQAVKANPQRHLLERSLTDRSLHWHLHPPRVAIVGPANAGKSTLANQLFGQERSITADLPGTTRDWVGETANINGLAVTLVDTPGIRKSDDAIETEAIRQAEAVVKDADLIVLVLDATRPHECDLVQRFPKAVRVVNKVDRAEHAAFDVNVLRTVGTTGEGIDALRAVIRESFGTGEIASVWTPRQRRIVEEALLDPAALADFRANF